MTENSRREQVQGVTSSAGCMVIVAFMTDGVSERLQRSVTYLGFYGDRVIGGFSHPCGDQDRG